MAEPPEGHDATSDLGPADVPARGLLEKLDIPMIAVSLAGEIVWANAACMTVSGFPLELLVGDRPPYRHWPDEDRVKLGALTAELLAGKERSASAQVFEYVFRTATGDRHRCEVIRELIYDRTGRVAGFLCAARPVLRDAVLPFGRHLRSLSRERLLRPLSPREREIATLLLAGLRVPAIARRLFLSPHTVRNHLKSVFRRLGVGSQSQLIELVLRADAAGSNTPTE